jgi:hypothetical protein
MSGKAAVQQLRYSRQAPDGTYEIDTDRIRAICEQYISLEAREQRTVTRNKREGTETTTITYKPISRQGLRRALGIGRQTYLYWLEGYVSANDKDDEDVLPNNELVEAMRVGDDAVLQYLAEDDDKYSQTKQIRLLESYGEIMPAKQVREINAKIELGKLGKYAK